MTQDMSHKQHNLSKVVFNTLLYLSIFTQAQNSFGFIDLGKKFAYPKNVAHPVIDHEEMAKNLERVIKANKSLSVDIKKFYEDRNYQPVWFHANNLNKAAKTAYTVLQDAHQEGLNTKNYEPAIKAIEMYKKGENREEFFWEEVEIRITDSIFDYIDHIRTGQVNPRSIHSIIRKDPPKIKVEAVLDKILAAHDDAQDLKNLAPKNIEYIELKDLLTKYQELAQKKPTWLTSPPQLPQQPTLKPKMTHASIPVLRKILFVYGDLKQNPNELSDQESQKYDDKLLEAVKKFQLRHTLEPDGVIGSTTRDALNMTLQERIHKVMINLERWRWMAKDLGNRHVLVNVAGYVVRAVSNNHIDLTLDAIVGQTSRKTPLQTVPMGYVVFNPYWGVPNSIFKRDKLGKIIQDPSSLAAGGFMVYNSRGEQVSADSVDWRNEHHNYYLKQRPGPKNALGNLKFGLKNSNAIHLHGTPNHTLFNKISRAFSSGCIRLKEPDVLAYWVLNQDQNWSKESIGKAIQAGKTRTVQLKNDIPTHFIYETVWVDDHGVAHFSNDPYKLDPLLVKALGF